MSPHVPSIKQPYHLTLKIELMLQVCQWHHWLSCLSIGWASLYAPSLTGAYTPRKLWLSRAFCTRFPDCLNSVNIGNSY